MPVPFILAVAGASGLTTAIGTTIASVIGISTVSSATAIALGTGALSGAVTAIKGGSVSEILKSAVVGGVTSFVGSSVAQNITNDVFFKAISSDISGTTSLVIAEAIGNGVGAALQGGLTAAAYGEDPVKAMVKNGLTAGLTAGTTALIDRTLGDIPGFKATDDPVELTFQRALKSAVATGIIGGDVGEAVKLSLLQSAGSALGTAIRNQLKDRSQDLDPAAKAAKDAYQQLENNLAEQEYLVNQYNEIE
jgi:hypothetical protein